MLQKKMQTYGHRSKMGQNEGGSWHSSTSKTGPSPGLSGHPAPCQEPEHGRCLQTWAERRAGSQAALEGSRPREQEEERASPRSPAQGDLPGPQASADMCWGTTAGLAAQRPLHWAPGRPPATPRQQLLLPGVPLDTTSCRTHLRRTPAFPRTKASRGLPPNSTVTPGGLVRSQQP